MLGKQLFMLPEIDREKTKAAVEVRFRHVSVLFTNST